MVMLQCTPSHVSSTMGHVTFHFHSFRVYQEKKYTLLIKQNQMIVLDEINRNKTLNPKYIYTK